MPVIARDSPLPLYHQLKQLLLDRIETGAWKTGDLIPAEQELQQAHGLSRTTVRQALRELEIEGRITRHRGRGSFVAPPKLSHSSEPRVSLSESLRARGMTPGWQVLSVNQVAATTDVAERLELRRGTRVTRIRRLRLADHEPIGVHVAHVAPAFERLIDVTALSSGGSLDYLRADAALAGSHAERILEAIGCPRAEAELLDVEERAPMLRIRRLITTAGGKRVEDLAALYRGDRFQYQLVTSTPE
jgi:GntR family transcriptional regulator